MERKSLLETKYSHLTYLFLMGMIAAVFTMLSSRYLP